VQPKYRRLSDVIADVCAKLGDIRELESIEPYFETDLTGLMTAINGQATMPAAIVTVDNAAHNEPGSRNSRVMDVAIYIIGSANMGRTGTPPLMDISDEVIETFSPPAATPARTLKINGVDYDPVVTSLLPDFEGRNVIQVMLKAFDYRQNR